MNKSIKRTRFAEVPLDSRFFESMKGEYREFESWFRRKAEEGAEAYVLGSGADITGFMYLKVEDGEVSDLEPPMGPARRIKIGTLKIEAHGTRL